MSECRQGDHRDGKTTATVRIRYTESGQDRWTTDMCDRHGALTYERFMREGRHGVEIMPAGWTPEHPVRRELERRTEPELHPINFDPYPATVGEVADEIARYVVELDSGVARGVLHDVIDRLNGEYARRNRVEQCESVCLGERCRHGRGHEGLHHADHGGAWRD